MDTRVKDGFLNWYNSLPPRDRKTLILLISFVLPLISGWIFFKELEIKNNIENKMKSLPSIDFIKSQIISAEKERVFYKQNIPKLKAEMLNPNIYYANNTPPNQIPIILHNQIKQSGGYILSMQEGIPTNVEVNENGMPASVQKPTTKPKKATKHKKKPTNTKNAANKIFRLELVPIKLSIIVSESNVSGFLKNLNTPNNAYPLLFINSISLGKSGCNTNNVLSSSDYYIISTYKTNVNSSTPTGICLSGYVLAKIELRGGNNVKQKK